MHSVDSPNITYILISTVMLVWYSALKSWFYIFTSMESAKEELEEYQTSSRELELELEAQLESAESKTKELITANSRLVMEVEGLRVGSQTSH